MKELFLRWFNKRYYLQSIENGLLFDTLLELCKSIDDMGRPNSLSGAVSDALDDAKKLLIVVKWERTCR